jgi:hypothetical protein
MNKKLILIILLTAFTFGCAKNYKSERHIPTTRKSKFSELRPFIRCSTDQFKIVWDKQHSTIDSAIDKSFKICDQLAQNYKGFLVSRTNNVEFADQGVQRLKEHTRSVIHKAVQP